MTLDQRIDHKRYFQKYGISFETLHTFFIDQDYKIWDAGFVRSFRRRDAYRPEHYVFNDVGDFCDRYNELDALSAVAEWAIDELSCDIGVPFDCGPDWEHSVQLAVEQVGGESCLLALKNALDYWLDEEIVDGNELCCIEDPIPVSSAYRFFRGRPEIEALEIALDESQHFGRTYYTAVLNGEIEEANEKCVELNLPYEFVEFF